MSTATAKPEQKAFGFVADEAIRRCFELLKTDRPAAACGPIWTRLNAASRIVWLHAACLDGGHCVRHWIEFDHDQHAALLLALENMTEFFQQVGNHEG